MVCFGGGKVLVVCGPPSFDREIASNEISVFGQREGVPRGVTSEKEAVTIPNVHMGAWTDNRHWVASQRSKNRGWDCFHCDSSWKACICQYRGGGMYPNVVLSLPSLGNFPCPCIG
ncbi:hypothetical protein SpiGrapes_1675 [Sphaerochaeta pleomorpha str. Grapes]|uniref:Uncharacterized protein n=2 Tax=Sphaerochaeta TaxID=399320 RepID=G8QWX4_SPHPG|nr:hypothetical protein SpiGrapes_1675 [Sphaerochaeta pleomorpha str. Grapes]